MLFEDTTRLGKIDELYALRLDQYVSLPLLVVIGDQSCGKSSVLEALTGLPLPRDAGLCTRFPTQLIFKRSKDQNCSVKIIPSHPGAEGRALVAEFEARHVDYKFSDDPEEFINLLKEASHCMGLPAPGEHRTPGQQAFSHDVLKIEVSGPLYEHFSVVDLPGPTPGQTTSEDMDLVRSMISSYIEQPRSIILAVLSANVDLATQEVDHMAEKVDPSCRRTLKVLTKPDLVDEGAEEKVVEYVLKDHQTSELGYTVVCNRKQKDLATSIIDRNQREVEYLSQEPWRRIPTDRAGIPALKRRLDNILVEITRKNFEHVSSEIRHQRAEAEDSLAALGQKRTNSLEQRLHLLDIVSRYEKITSRAIDAYYGKDICFHKYDCLRLATRVKSQHVAFSRTMERHGSLFSFSLRSKSQSRMKTPEATETSQSSNHNLFNRELSEDEHESERSSLSGSENVSEPEPLTDHAASHHIDLKHFVMNDQRPESGKANIMKWVGEVYNATRGFEIATVNPSVLPSLFREQIKPWAYHSNVHVLNVASSVHCFIQTLLLLVCEDEQVSTRLWNKLKNPLVEAYRAAFEQVDFLITVEKDGNLLTTNHYLADNLDKARAKRFKKRMQDMDSWKSSNAEKEPLLRFQDVMRLCKSNERYTVEDIYDALRAYYKVVRKRFVDSVCMQAVDHYLLCSREGPLRVLCTAFIANMTEKELLHIAGEDRGTIQRRADLHTKIDCLRKGEQILLG